MSAARVGMPERRRRLHQEPTTRVRQFRVRSKVEIAHAALRVPAVGKRRDCERPVTDEQLVNATVRAENRVQHLAHRPAPVKATDMQSKCHRRRRHRQRQQRMPNVLGLRLLELLVVMLTALYTDIRREGG